MIKSAIGNITGKTISSVIVTQDNTSGPPNQIFLVFNDGSYYEIYCTGAIHSAGGLDSGGEETVMNYIRGSGGSVTRYP